jgi:hypothetical protein
MMIIDVLEQRRIEINEMDKFELKTQVVGGPKKSK